MIGPLSSQLNAIKWGEFKLGDLFEASNGDFDIQKRHINHKGELVITAGLSNNGVLGQSDIKAKVFESHTITIDMFGCAFYRSFAYKMVTHARVFSLKPKFEINHKIGLFLSTLFFGYPKKFGYENMCSWAKIKNDKVILPLKPNANTQTLKDIDFHFMEKFIAELEAYLKATGLSNTTLSNDEENALNVFNNSGGEGGNTPCGLTWQSFKLGDLFEKVSARFLGKGDKFKATSKSITDTHNIPLVYCKKGNNGIMYWGKKGDFETYNNIISIIYNGVIATGLTYAHRDEVGILAESYFIKFKNGNPNFLCNLFIKTAIEKVLYPKYSRDNLATWANKVENESILLPTDQHGKIDFPFMHTLINALMKQTIQGVAEYSSAKIQAAKEVISQETPTPKDSLF
ncbi:restriction endonuclease subunit S [Helicobacter pylori]